MAKTQVVDQIPPALQRFQRQGSSEMPTAQQCAMLSQSTTPAVRGTVALQWCKHGWSFWHVTVGFPMRDRYSLALHYRQQNQGFPFWPLRWPWGPGNRSDSVNPVNKKTSHRIFRHIHGVLNEVCLQNFLHEWAVNCETNLMSLFNP